jgi:AcrR family transcriptional regulator
MIKERFPLKPDNSLSIRNPERTKLGHLLIREGAAMMIELGLEGFTLKKLAARVNSTEVTMYKYFPNKQRLLQYYFQLYWLWMRQLCDDQTDRLKDPEAALKVVVDSLCGVWPKKLPDLQLDAKLLRLLVINEGMKSYLQKNVDADNAQRLFKHYKDLSAYVADQLLACRSDVPMPRSFATTMIEMAHSLPFAMEHLPSLTELSSKKDLKQLSKHLYDRTITYVEHAKTEKRK